MVPAFMLSLLGRQRQLLGERFLTRYPSDWLVWEPGPWRPARSEATSNTEATQLPQGMPFRPVGEDALCFELKRVGGKLLLGRATDNHIVINDLTVSRAQFHLEYDASVPRWSIHTDGLVMVDGRPGEATGTPLKNGSPIVIGDVRLTFHDAQGFVRRLEGATGAPSLPVPGATPLFPKRR